MRIAFGTDEVTPVTDGLIAHLGDLGHDVSVVGGGEEWPEVGRAVGQAVADGSGFGARAAARRPSSRQVV